jgi:hypothetical protein
MAPVIGMCGGFIAGGSSGRPEAEALYVNARRIVGEIETPEAEKTAGFAPCCGCPHSPFFSVHRIAAMAG